MEFILQGIHSNLFPGSAMQVGLFHVYLLNESLKQSESNGDQKNDHGKGSLQIH
jgi:hypothetical protein